MNWKRIEVFFEFLVFGVVVGVIEDLIAIEFATDASITPRVFGIVVAVAVPFAVLGELVVDKIDFVEIFKRWFGNNNDNNQP